VLAGRDDERPSRRRNPPTRGRRAGGRGTREAVAGRTFYHFVRRHPVTERDFWSRKRRGLPPRGPELRDPDLHDSISVWDELETARAKGRLRRPPRGLIARLDIPAELGPGQQYVTGRPTLGPGHWSLWGDPATFLKYVVYPLLEI
jgi:hypothetical protein